MFNDKKILALIPARGGSKGIKGKNIVLLNGKPLISYTISAAANSKYIDNIIVSTDNEKIKEVSLQYGANVPFVRPREFATDTSKTIEVVLHAVKAIEEEYDILVLLQPTQPLRNTLDIDNAIEKFFSDNERSLVSISEVNDNPVLMRYIDDNGDMQKLLMINSTCRRQDMPKYYRVNGCIYINKVDDLNMDTSFNDNESYYIMPRERSVDIDEMSDLSLAEYYLRASCTSK